MQCLLQSAAEAVGQLDLLTTVILFAQVLVGVPGRAL
jgi:hypothetical protein